MCEVNKPKTKNHVTKTARYIHSVEEKQVLPRQMLTTVITDESYDACIFLSYCDFDHCLLNLNI